MTGSLVASVYSPVIQTSVGVARHGAGFAHLSHVFSCPGFLQKKHERNPRVSNAGEHLLSGRSGARQIGSCPLSSRLPSLGCRHLSFRKFRVHAVGETPDGSKDDSEGEGWSKRQLDEGKTISTNQSSDETDVERWSGDESVSGSDGNSAGTSEDASGSSEAIRSETRESSESEDAQTKRVLDILHRKEGEAPQISARSLRERFGGFRVSGPQVPMTLQPSKPLKPRKGAAAKSGEKPEKAAEESVKPVQEGEGSSEALRDLTPETESSTAEDRLSVGDVSGSDASAESTSATIGSGEAGISEALGSSQAESSDPLVSRKAESVGTPEAESSEPVGSIKAESSEVETDSSEVETDLSETENDLSEVDSDDASEEEEEQAVVEKLRAEAKAANEALPEMPMEDIPIPPTTPEDERLRAAFEETLLSDWKVEGLEGELQLYVTKVKALEEFEKELARPDDDIDLVRTSALIAQHAYPDCTPEDCESQLRFLAEELKELLPPPSERYPLRMIKAINKFLYEEQGFKGSWGTDRDMYSPKLLCLNKVLANKSGMPILMSVVYLELARRVGFPMVGVNLPLHFVIRPMATDCEFLVDPHDGGKLMFLEDVQEKLASVFKAKVVVNPDFISNTPAVPKRTILFRILNNLKRKYFANRNYSECLQILEYMKRVQPPAEEPGLYRDVGLCLFALRRTKEAIPNLDAYLTAAPDALDADAMRDLLQKIRDGGL